MTTILGFDPGAVSTGFAEIKVSHDTREITVANYGTIPVIGHHFQDTYEWITVYCKKHLIDVMCYEMYVFSKYQATPKEKIITVQVQGIIELIGEELGIYVDSYTASSVRGAICGGTAKKQQVRKTLMRFLNLPKIHDLHAVDAIATACCCAMREFRAAWPTMPTQQPLDFQKPQPSKRKPKLRDMTDEQIAEAIRTNRAVYDDKGRIVGVK